MSVLADIRPLRIVNLAGGLLAPVLGRFAGQITVSNGTPNSGAPWDVGDADILVTGPSAAWRAAPSVPPAGWANGPRWVQILSAGVDGFPDWLLRDRLVTCGRGDAAVPIAEFVLTALLMHEKRLDQLRPSGAADWPTDKRGLSLGTLDGATLGLAGYGAIGRAVTKRALAFGMKVVACRRGAWSSEDRSGIEVVDRLEALVQQIDHLVLALPLTPETRGCVDQRLLKQARSGLHLINVARGALVDEEALLAALDAGTVGSATLDVTAQEPLPDGHPFYTHPRVRLTPHISWAGPHVSSAIADRFEDNLRNFLAGKPLRDVVDPARGY